MRLDSFQCSMPFFRPDKCTCPRSHKNSLGLPPLQVSLECVAVALETVFLRSGYAVLWFRRPVFACLDNDARRNGLGEESIQVMCGNEKAWREGLAQNSAAVSSPVERTWAMPFFSLEPGHRLSAWFKGRISGFLKVDVGSGELLGSVRCKVLQCVCLLALRVEQLHAVQILVDLIGLERAL